MGTSKAAEMTSKEKVLSVYPDATAYHTSDNYWTVLKTNTYPRVSIYPDGVQYTEAEAWEAAKNQLPSAPSNPDTLKRYWPGAVDDVDGLRAVMDEHPDGDWVRYADIAAPIAPAAAEGDGWIAVTDADREETNGDCVGWECITDIEQLRKVLCVVSDERYAAIRQLKEKCHE